MSSSSTAGVTRTQSRAEERLGGQVALRYVARAGLLPELSRQTYDSFYKAIREAVLNALDAEASRIEIDFSQVASRRQLTVSDDGTGMSTKEFCEQFMSLGGSSKFGDARRFGRIGIGSLALLQYAEAAVVETKPAGAATATRARIHHPWTLGRTERRARLGDLPAGFAEQFDYPGSLDDHFTCVRLEGVSDEVWSVGHDATAFYRLLDDLRRVLPLPWSEGRLVEALKRVAPELVELLRQEVTKWAAPVVVHSSWEREIRLARRWFGDDQAATEDWSGPPLPLLKELSIPGEGRRRRIAVAGYLLNQRRAQASWSGITARVQNVAVEERTFFDVTSDPGFRKYISGELWLLGEVDRERLINIDRSSFNKECPDYRSVQRFMGRAIVEFKSASVQRPQRQKVEVRRRLEEHIRVVQAVRNVAERAAEWAPSGQRGLPSSERHRRPFQVRRGIVDVLAEVGARVVIDEARAVDDLHYELDLTEDGAHVKAVMGRAVTEPRVRAGAAQYRVAYAVAGADYPPVLIRNRPREIVFNTSHPAHAGERQMKYALSLALEVAYLLGEGDTAMVYELMLSLTETI